jgi:hypothetical protein
MEALLTSVTSAYSETTRRYIPEDSDRFHDGGRTHLWNVDLLQHNYTRRYIPEGLWWMQYAPLKRRSTPTWLQTALYPRRVMMDAVRTSETSVYSKSSRCYIPESLMMEVVRTSETSVYPESTRRYIPEGSLSSSKTYMFLQYNYVRPLISVISRNCVAPSQRSVVLFRLIRPLAATTPHRY